MNDFDLYLVGLALVKNEPDDVLVCPETPEW